MKQRPRVSETWKVDNALREHCLRGLIAHVFKVLTVKVTPFTFCFLIFLLLQNSIILKLSCDPHGFARFELH
jgi:hypothetical protein